MYANAKLRSGRGSLREIHRVVESRLLAARQIGPRLHDMVKAVSCVTIALDQRCRHDGASVDQRIVGQTAIVEDHLVEAAPTRLSPDVIVGDHLTVLLESQCVIYGFTTRLNAEIDFRVTQRETLTINGTQRDRKLVGIHARELGNVASHISALVLGCLGENGRNLVTELVELRNDHLALEGLLDQQDTRPDDGAKGIVRDLTFRAIFVQGRKRLL